MLIPHFGHRYFRLRWAVRQSQATPALQPPQRPPARARLTALYARGLAGAQLGARSASPIVNRPHIAHRPRAGLPSCPLVGTTCCTHHSPSTGEVPGQTHGYLWSDARPSQSRQSHVRLATGRKWPKKKKAHPLTRPALRRGTSKRESGPGVGGERSGCDIRPLGLDCCEKTEQLFCEGGNGDAGRRGGREGENTGVT